MLQLINNMARIQLTKNSAIKRPKAGTIVLVADYDSLVKSASTKFRINQHKIRFFTTKNTIKAKQGTEICNQTDFDKYIMEDILLAVSNGDDYLGKTGGIRLEGSEAIHKICKPPRHPYPGAFQNIDRSADISDQILEDITEPHIIINYSKSKNNYEMNGIFPIFEGNVLDSIRKVIKQYPKIKEHCKNGYISFDYLDNAEFPINDHNLWEIATIRECRGLIISPITGNVLARRYHKFFNINEREETYLENINLENFTVYEKLDGTLVSPVLLDDGSLIWASRKNEIDEVLEFIKHSEIKYNDFAVNYLRLGITPLFEWCHDTKHVGVLTYSQKQLILTGLRNNVTGQYLNISEISISLSGGVPCANIVHCDNISDLLTNIRESVNREGVVISIPSGEKYKLKSYWYVDMVKGQTYGGDKNFLPEIIKLRGNLKNIPADKIWLTVLQNVDDVIAMCISMLSEEDAKEFKLFVHTLKNNLTKLMHQLTEWTRDQYAIAGDIQSICYVLDECGYPAFIAEAVMDDIDYTDKFIQFLIQLAKRKHIHSLDELLDIHWNDEIGKMEINNSVLDICTFHTCDQKIIDHVLTTYFPKKICNMLGIKHIAPETTITFPKSYSANEGKIIGMWEMFTKDNIHDLRIDLQPPQKIGYSDHYGNPEYALFLVQYGLFNNVLYPHGEFAGILVPTDETIKVVDMISALEHSFNSHKLIKLRRKNIPKNTFKVFCDLDGVLADFEKGIQLLTGRSTIDQSASKMWQRISAKKNFFAGLDFMPDGAKLWKDICEISGSIPTILTGVPESKNNYDKEKRQWCANHLGDDVEVITCKSSEKYKYTDINHILIDDRIENCNLWEKHGGICIRHTNNDRTIYELKKIFKMHKKQIINIELQLSETYTNTHTNTVNIVVDIFPKIECDLISIDCEWIFNDNTYSIFQISTNDQTYIIDNLNCNQVVREQLHKLLENPKITKLCWGMSIDEIQKIGCKIINCIDLQEICADNFDILIANNVPSLYSAVYALLGIKMNKSKELQAGDWNKRPLSDEQIEYAANDVTILFKLYDKLQQLCYKSSETSTIMIPKKNIELTDIKHPKNKKDDDFDINTPVKILYCGIFLSEQSKKELLRLIPPIHSKIYASHVTMIYNPSEQELRGIPIGEIIEIYVTGISQTDQIQTVCCECFKQKYHITISTDENTEPNCSNDIKNWTSIKPFQLFGTVGVQTIAYIDELASLTAKTKSKLIDFQQTGLVGQSLKFKPGELSSSERAVIHQFAENNNIVSQSSGPDDKRQLILTKKKYEIKTNPTKNELGEIKKITDFYQFSMLSIINANADIITKGSISASSINIQHDILDNTLIILRGLPGSGKSHICKINTMWTYICSADDYFMKNGQYEFNKNLLDQAHQYCFQKVKNGLDLNENIIVVDNTNSTLKEYVKYKKIASYYNYNVIVIEIYCKNRDQAIMFASRNNHNVPIATILKMLARWEYDPEVILVSPYIEIKGGYNDTYDESLYKWLSDNKLFHFNKHRKYTHMSFEIGTKPCIYINIPDDFYDEFLKRYIASGIYGDETDEPKYIMENPNSAETFRMFFDIDYISESPLDTQNILKMVNILQKFISGSIYVTGCISPRFDKIKTGLHFVCNGVTTNSEEAIYLYNGYIDLLKTEMPSIANEPIDWESWIDSGVYGESRGMRMLGSRKTIKGIDQKRIYKLFFVVNEDGEISSDELSDLELMKNNSVFVY